MKKKETDVTVWILKINRTCWLTRRVSAFRARYGHVLPTRVISLPFFFGSVWICEQVSGKIGSYRRNNFRSAARTERSAGWPKTTTRDANNKWERARQCATLYLEFNYRKRKRTGNRDQNTSGTPVRTLGASGQSQGCQRRNGGETEQSARVSVRIRIIARNPCFDLSPSDYTQSTLP